MAKKSFNAQDIFFNHNGKVSIIDPYPHRGKEPIEERGLYKFPRENMDTKSSDKGFPNTITMPYVTDKEKEESFEESLTTIGVLIDTDEGPVFHRFRNSKENER